MMRRMQERAGHAALAALVLGHGALLWRWVRMDARPGRSICCDLVGSVAERAGAAGLTAAGAAPRSWTPDRGWLPALAYKVTEGLGGDPDGLLVIGAASLLVGMLATYGIGRRLSGPIGGLTAAAVLPCVPALALAARRWDVYGTQAGVLCLAAWALVRSRSLSRPMPVLLFSGLAVAGVFLSPRETDGFLVVSALGAMGLGAWLRGLFQGRGPSGVRVSRWRVLLGGLFVACLIGWSLHTWVVFTSPEGLGYYLREAERNTAAVDPASWTHRSAVIGRIFWRDLTPWLAIPVEVAILMWLLRGKGRCELGAWILLPLIALSLLPKKNHYYASVLIPALPLVLGLGVAAIPGRWLQRSAAIAIITMATIQLLVRTSPGGRLAQLFEGTQWQGGDPTWGGVFQTSDGDMQLAPDPHDRGASAVAEAVRRAWPRDHCGCGLALRTKGPGPWSAVNLDLLATHPCLPVKQGGRLGDAVVLVVSDPEGHGETHSPSSLSAVGFTLADTVPVDDNDVRVHVRTGTWMEARCRPQ